MTTSIASSPVARRAMRWASRLALAAVLIAGAACTGRRAAPAATAQPTATVTPAATASGANSAAAAPASSGDFTSAVQRVSAAVKPAVVQITTEEVQQNAFAQGMAVPTGLGSGVLFDDQGHILTNHHVIAGGQQIRVSLADGRTFDGKVVGSDPQTDLAVVQVQGPNLPKAPLGQAKELQVGEWVVAIGHALGLSGGPTVTTGVVSALNRTVQEPSESGGRGPFLFGVIQTDASINPGNSGGPLVNLRGQVIGLNTLVAGQTSAGGAQAEGIGFAISIDTARTIADQIIKTGKVVHAYLGIRYVTLTPAVAAQLNVRGATEGALIGEVVAGSPAASGGVRAQDVVTKIDGKALQGESALAEIVDGHRPGDTITLTVLRGGAFQDLKVTLGQQ